MKMTNKIKKIFLISTLSTLAIVPCSIFLSSCNNSSTSNLPNIDSKYQVFSSDFISNGLDKKIAPLNINQEQYDFLFKYLHKKSAIDNKNEILKKVNAINSGFSNQDDAKLYSQQLLNDLTVDDAAKMLLINFNKNSSIFKNVGTYNTESNKDLYTINNINLDQDSGLISFELNYSYSSVVENSFSNYNSKIYSLISQEFIIQFNNLKLLPIPYKIDNYFIPALTLDVTSDSSIKYVKSNVNKNLNQFKEQQVSFLNYQLKNNLITNNVYNSEITNLKNYLIYNSNLLNSENNVSSLDYNSIKPFISNDSNIKLIEYTPFMSSNIQPINNDLSDYKASNYNIGLCELINKNNTNQINIARTSYSYPVFNFIKFNSDNSDFEIVNKDN